MSPVLCGEHEYVGFQPCPRCARITVHPETIVLDGQRVVVVTETKLKPWWIPGFVFRWMVRVVVKTQHVSVTVTGHRAVQKAE